MLNLWAWRLHFTASNEKKLPGSFLPFHLRTQTDEISEALLHFIFSEHLTIDVNISKKGILSSEHYIKIIFP